MVTWNQAPNDPSDPDGGAGRAISFSNPRRLAASPEAINVVPVTFPPGRARLATRAGRHRVAE